MSEFNVDEYFATRSRAFKAPDGSDFINAKYLELQQTTQNKVRELAERSSLAAKQEAVDADTWGGKLDLAPHSLQGNVVNVVGSVYQGATGVAGRVLSAAPSALAAANQANLSEDDIAALNRHQQGQSTPEDLARINRKVAPIVAPTPGMPRDLAQAHANERAQAMADLNPNAPTPLSIWAEMNKAREISRGINESADNSSVVRLRDQAAFGADLTNTYNDNAPQIAKGWEDLKNGSKLGGAADVAVGVAKLLFGGLSDVAGNKQATLEHIAQNAPQLLVGLFGKAGAMAQLVDNVSAAGDIYNKGILDYQAKNGGALPPEDQRQYMAFMAASSAAAEQVGDKIGLAATKLGGETVKDVSRASFKSALKGTAVAVGEGVLSEAPTEAWQQFAEGEILGKPATGAEIFAAGVIGGASGGGLSGGGRAVHEAAKLATQPTAAKQETIDQRKAQEAAIASGDVSKLTDPVEQIAALVGHSQKADTTPEQKQTNLAKAKDIVSALEEKQAEAEQVLSTSTVAGVQALIAERQAQLTDPEVANDPAKVALFTQSIELAQADLADLVNSKDQKGIETAAQKQLDTVKTQLREAKLAKDNLELLVQPSSSVDEDIALIGAKSQEEANDALTAGVAPRATAAGGVSKEQTAAADRIITLAMTAPDRLDTSVVAKLAADTSNALTVPQRTYLSAFVRAQQTNPTLTSSLVAEDIYEGKHGNRGVVQYRTAMSKALAAGSQKMADIEMAGITKFAEAHQNKADAAAQALKLGLGTSILKEGGQWVVGAPGVAVTAEQHKAGGRTITSGRLAFNIKNEAQALADVASELQAAYDLKFNAPKEASNVKNVSQQGTGTKTKEEGTTDQAAKPTGDSVAVESVSTADAKPAGVVGTGVVEADGVDLGTRSFNDLTDPAERINLYRGEGTGNKQDGGWWTFDKADAEKYATSSNGKVRIRVMTAKEIADQTVQGQGGARHRLFPNKADVGIIESTEKSTSTEETLVSSVNTEETQSTEKIESTEEEVKSTTELTTSEPTQPDGKLEVMATKSPEGTPFNLRNLIADNFTQAGGKPLTDVKNFFSFLYAKIDEQPAAIQSFLKHAKVWNERIKAGLSSVGNPDYRYEDMMRFLITDKDGIADIDENVKTAISSVVYLYVASEATSPQYHKDRGINSILGRGKTDWVSPAAREELAHVGVYQYQLVDSLGGAVMEALGFKANPDAGLENEAKLRVALGAHAMKLLEGGNNPLMTRHTVSGETMQYLREEGLDEKQLARLRKSQGTTDTSAPHTFFAIARNPDGTVVPGVARIFEANKGSKDILGQLFKAPPTVKLPSLVPVTEVAKTAAGTNQSVPEEQQEALKIMQSREHFVREDSLDFLGEFSEEDQLTMMGVVEEENATTHRVNRISVQAKNDGLRREWTNFQEYVGEYLATAEKKLKTPFFFKFSPWKNQRTGIDNTVVNPQTSKIARALVTSARWETEIALDNKELMDSFYLGVAEGLGVKTERQDNQLSVDAIIDTLATPIYAAAVAAIRKRMIHKESLSDQEKDAVLLAVAKGGANLHSLDALIGMAYHAEAVAAKATTFVSRVYREVDGVANGTMLNHVLLGAAENQEALAAMLEHGGFFGKDSQYTHYSHYRGTTGNMDIYESTGRKVHEGVTAAVGKAGNAVVDSIWAIGGSIFDPATGIVSKAGRNLVKDGMNPLGFGSALDTVVAKMGTTFVDTIYTGFEKLAKSGALQTEIDEFVAHINTLIGKTNTTAHIPVNKPIAFYMEMVLTNNSRNAILDSFSGTVGLITSNVLESEFKVFLERRNDLNSAAQTVSGMYDAMQRGIREDYIEQLIASGDIELDKVGNPVSDLSKAQEAELTRLLQSMAPVLRTAMSKNDTKGNGTRSGLLMSKTKRKQSNNPAYKTVSKFATALSNRAKSVKLTALGKFFETIGVSMGSAATHSTDSRIMLMVQKMLDVLGIHDAAIDGIKGAKETANLLNKNTWDTLLNYSPLEEVYLSMANLVQGMAEVIENGDMPPQSLHYVNVFLAEQRWKQRIVGNTLQGLLTKAKKSAHKADETKLGFMSTSGVIDQYAFQGGQYQVTQANRDEAAQNLETLSDKIPKEILDALAVVQKALKNPGAMKRPVAPVAEATEATEDTAEDAEGSWFDALDELVKGPETSPFGELGESEFANRPEVLEAQKLELFLRDNPNTTAHTLLKEAYALLKARPASPTRDFRLQLLDRLRLTIHKDIKVHLITENTKGSEHTSRPPYKGAAAWFDADGAGLFFMSSDFKSSYFTVEAILHEMTHDALLTVVEAAERGEGSEQSNQMVKELQDLLKEARIFAKKNGLDEKHKLPLENLHEFLAYGLTRTGFQTDVLMAMQAPTKKGAISGLTKFVQTVIGILFKGSKDQLVMNGFTAFITNADGLFTSSQRTRELSDGNYSESDTTFTESNTEKSVVTPIDPSAPFKLNEGQQSAYDAAVAFLKSKKESFSIIGSAGTGKTTIVKTILDNLAKEGINKFSRIVLTSPTHRANAVTRSKNPSADIVTIHKLLGLSPSVNLEEFDARNVKFEKKAEGETETMPINGLLIVDESSMINDALFEALMQEAKTAGTKVIFLGDMAQLGPVKQTTESKALISTDGQTNLTQVMRAKNAALLDESVALRQSGEFTAVSSMVQGNGVRFMNEGEAFINRAVKFFTAEEFKKNPLLVRVLAFRNATVASYNTSIRAAIHGEAAAAYVPGDLLMGYAAFGAVDKGTGMSQVSNGVDYIVQSVGGTKTGLLFGVQVEVVTLTVKDVFGLNKGVTIDVVSPTTPGATIQKIGAAAQAMIVSARTDRSKWRMFYTEKAKYALPFDLTADDNGRTTALAVKTLDYGYAHTIHKSQGGTYTFVMVDANDVSVARTEKDRKRLRYVGLTRAERGAFVLTDAAITDAPAGNLAMAAPQAPTNTYSTIDIHDALADGSLTNEFDEHLRSLLGGIVYNLHGAFGSFKKTLMKDQALDATDVWLKALNTGVAPFASEALGHIATTPQVAYALEQVEATVRAALETNESQTKMVYKELYKLYGEAEKLVTVQSLVDAGLDAVTAQATHDMLFKLEKTSGNRSNYLARFAALGLAHPVINQVLQAATARDSRTAKDAKTFLERLEIIFENLLRVFQTYVTRTYQGQPANDKLLSLVGQLVDIEAKYQRRIKDKASKSNYLEPLEANIKVFVEAAGAKIEAVADSSYIRNHKNTYVKVAGGLVGTVAGGRADIFMDELFKLRAEVFKKRFGVVASLAQAYVGQNVVLQGLLRMTKLLEGDRQDQVAGWAKSALEAFADNGKMLRGKTKDNVAARASISSVFMRTGAHNLMGDFDMAGIEQLVTDKTALNTAITSFENQLAVHGKAAPYYVNQANALGYQKATGVARTKFVNQNAHAISKLAGTGQELRVSTAQAEQAEATLKVLITLYALRYSNDIAVGHAGRVIKAENQRADGMNGLEFTLLLQKRLEKESLERLFGNNPMLMVHGYTSEIYDPHVSIKTANVLEGKALVEQGYVQRSVVPVDPADADQDIKHIYVLQDGGMPRFVSGAISNRGMQAKGKTIHNGYLNVYNATGIANAAQNAALVQDRQAAIADMFRPGPVKDLSKEKGNYLVPVFNEYGKVVNWRYMMAETTKDNILNRNNRFDKVLGTIAGSIYDKETSREQNMASVKALYEQYQTDYKNNPKSYVDISPKSDDPEMREIWNLLPEDTRKDILSVWGHKGMTVKTENLDIMFGYRKLTVGTIFQKANEERDARKAAGGRTEVMSLKTIDAWQKLIVLMFESPLKGEALVKGKTMEEALRYARKAGDNAVRTEHIVQAIVSEAKDIIVVKSGLVLLGNMGSNIWLLGMSGVPILDVMGHHLVAWKGAVSWKKDTEELEHLKRLRDTGYTQGNKADIDRRILRLEDALDRNPVKELVEAGLMPTIVEDINPEDDLYSYKSQLVRKVETVTDKMNPTLVKAARTAYLAHDTKIYQAMSQITKLSDFMARYTMYQHLISKKDPLSKSEATQKVSEAFINYDIALHRSIQYTDDMGITMFTKYFIGIQKVLMDTVRENPARVLTGVLLSKFLGLGPTVLDGSMWNHVGNNPFRTGPFELLDAISELPMVNAPLAMFNMGGSPAP